MPSVSAAALLAPAPLGFSQGSFVPCFPSLWEHPQVPMLLPWRGSWGVSSTVHRTCYVPGFTLGKAWMEEGSSPKPVPQPGSLSLRISGQTPRVSAEACALPLPGQSRLLSTCSRAAWPAAAVAPSSCGHGGFFFKAQCSLLLLYFNKYLCCCYYIVSCCVMLTLEVPGKKKIFSIPTGPKLREMEEDLGSVSLPRA